MLEHLNPTPQKPSRVVVLGAYGFVGGTCARLLAARGVPVLPLDKDDIDLTASGAAEQLQTRLAPGDTILVVSARAPCKDTGMMVDNIRIMHAVCTALERSSVNHVVFFSSDAVYSDAPVPLTEESRTEPGSMHGTMHLARELMLKAIVKAPLAVVRSTLIYGDGGIRTTATGPTASVGWRRQGRRSCCSACVAALGARAAAKVGSIVTPWGNVLSLSASPNR